MYSFRSEIASGLPDFLGPKYQMDKKYFQWPQNSPNGHKIYQDFSIARPSKIYPNWDFWFENKPSGNPE
jgi:hypothetical protein